MIGESAVDLGDASTPRDVPSFKNTLSAGDRSALGLAFFLAKLEKDPDLSNRIVVFDDPFTSLDGSRRMCTGQRVRRLARDANQVLLLSHNPGFLHEVWEPFPTADIRTLQLTRVGANTTITLWDIEEESRDEYTRTFIELRKYRDEGEGDDREIVKKIRPLLEGYLRLKFPEAFERNEWLGNMIRKIRESQDGDQLQVVKAVLCELEDLNDYSKKYHHDQNPGCATEPVNTTELETFVVRLIKLVGGF